jgi:peptidoglycan/xylan/chitin deacetylase (PgdA/CDA1 family)
MPRKIRDILILNLGFSVLLCGFAGAAELLEPQMTIRPGSHHGPHVALTFDACSGAVDERILRALIQHRIKATIFASARWLKHNPLAVAELNAHQDLFEVENHGARHVPAVDVPMQVFGLKSAGSPQAVAAEITGGADAVRQATGRDPLWFRGAAGKYTASSIKQVNGMHFRLAGYSLLGDGGAMFSKSKTASTIANARDGDVIIAHINQPKRPAGLGVVAGILKLKEQGFIFLRLADGV